MIVVLDQGASNLISLKSVFMESELIILNVSISQ